MLYARFFIPILALARTRPMLRTRVPVRPIKDNAAPELGQFLEVPGYFFDRPQRKTFFRRDTFHSMDFGFHEGIAINNSKKKETDFTYIHYHHKPYNWLVESSKNKLRRFFDPDDEKELRDPKNANRLTDFINQGEDSYMEKFKSDNVVHLPDFMDRLKEIGVKPPFSV